MSQLDPNYLSLADQIGERIAVRLIQIFSHGEVPIAPEYLTAFQAARLSGFTSKALESMRSRREGPAYFKVGSSIRYRVADVRSWIEGAARS